MDNQMSKSIKELQSIFEKDYFDTHIVRSTLNLIRKLLEEKGISRTDYPFLWLYCDWNVHTRLDKNPEVFEILYSLTKILSGLSFINKWIEDGNGVLVWRGDEALSIEVNKSLAMPELREEFTKLFTSCNLPVSRFADQVKWVHFSSIMIQSLMEYEIKLPDNIENFPENTRQKTIYNNIKHKSRGNTENQVMKFSLVPRDRIPEKAFQARHENIDTFFLMETKSGHYFWGPFWTSKLTF
jgi:hypothetical protein